MQLCENHDNLMESNKEQSLIENQTAKLSCLVTTITFPDITKL